MQIILNSSHIIINDHECLNLALLYAIQHDHLEIADFLIENGADVRFEKGKAFEIAIMHECYDIIDLLIKKILIST